MSKFNFPATILAICSLATFASGQLDGTIADAPIAKKVDHITTLHGQKRNDPYHWIRTKSSKETIAHLNAENAYTDAILSPFSDLKESLYKEIIGRIKEDDSDVPYLSKGYYYYSRFEKGKEYPLICRKKGSLQGKEEVIVDGNALAKGKKFFSLGATEVSPNSRYLAYSTDYTGFREYYVKIKDLQTGKILSDEIGKANQLVWASDSKTIFFVTEDKAKRWDKVWRYTVGSKSKPKLVVEEKDELFWTSIGKSNDDRFLFIDIGSKDTNEVHYLPLDRPTGSPTLIAKRGTKSKLQVDAYKNEFFISTNDKGANFRLVRAPISRPGASNWKEVIPHRPMSVLSGVACFKDFMVVSQREGGFTQLALRDYKTGKLTPLKTEDSPGTISLGANPEYDTKTIRYEFTSLRLPESTYEYEVKSGKSKLLKRAPVLGGYKPSDYVSSVVWATARDGKTRVPISLVRKKSTVPSNKTPLMLYAYGSYGAPSDPYFSVSRLSLLDRGFIFAIAHIRGGGEFGLPWYEDGKMGKKMNTFTDFIDCADYLVKKGYTSPSRMAINGGSAGGLLIGAVVNLRPTLCKAAILDVPFVDVINTMLDETLPLTVGEFVEWGNPKVKSQYDWMIKYSPYDNIVPKVYPDILVNTSINDSQVMYWEPAKYVAKMRANKTDSNALLLRCNMDAGHGGASGRYERYKEVAEMYTFVLSSLNLARQ